MDSLRPDTLADHLVAWHNSDRLARRIRVAHVTSIGYVVLPFARAQAPDTAAPAAVVAEPPRDPASAAETHAQAQARTLPSPGLAAPVPVEESDEPIEVLIDAPDLDLGAPEEPASDLTIAEPRAPEQAQEVAEEPQDAPLDIAFDATLKPAAEPAPDSEPSADGPADETAEEALPAPADTPEAAAPAAEGLSLRERAMARAQQMGSETGSPAAQVPAAAAAASAATHPAASAAPAASADSLEDVQWPAASDMAVAAPGRALDDHTAPLVALFNEDFIPPLKPAEIAEFALQYGASHASPGKNGLVRVIKPNAHPAGVVLEQRWLLTAQIDIGGKRTRLLVGAGPEPTVLGQRLSGVPQLALLAGPPLVVAAAAGLWWLWPTAPPPKAQQAPAPATAASAAVVAASGPASAAAAAASAPVDVEPTLGRVELPSIAPIVDERRRAAAAETAARVASAASATAAPLATNAQAQNTVPPPAVVGPAFAVSTRLLRTRTESEQMAEAMRVLLAGTGPPGLQVQALRSGDDWRVVVWPYTEQGQAEQARALLASRGMKVTVIDF